MGAWVHVNYWVSPKEKGQNGYFKEKLVEVDSWYTVMSCFDDDLDGNEIECETIVDAWRMWQEEKRGDEAVGQAHSWKYRFYYHKIVKENGQFVDYVTPVKIYRRGNKIFAKATNE